MEAVRKARQETFLRKFAENQGRTAVFGATAAAP